MGFDLVCVMDLWVSAVTSRYGLAALVLLDVGGLGCLWLHCLVCVWLVSDCGCLVVLVGCCGLVIWLFWWVLVVCCAFVVCG